MIPFSRAASLLLFFALGVLWLASFRMADALTFFKTYSSFWFLPAGVTMAIVMVAPGWLKLAPLAANLLIALPVVRAVIGVSVVNDYEPLLHGVRLFAVYGGAGFLLVRLLRIELPATSLRDYRWITVVSFLAVTTATATGIGMHMLSGNMTPAEARDVVWSWWLGDAIGAFAIPPMLVPLLGRWLRADGAEWHWPAPLLWLEQIGTILVICLVGTMVWHLTGVFQVWYLLVLPPVLFALRGGLPMSATCVFLTVVTVPLLAGPLALQNNIAELSPLLLATTVAGLLLGAAMSDQQKMLGSVEQLVEDRTRELKEAHEFQRHLIRSIGHDVRQPIEGMNMLLEGLAIYPRSPEESAAILRTRQIGAHASQLLSSILTYARFEAGGVTVQAEDFPIDRLFGALAQLFEPFAALKDVTLVWRHNAEVLNSDETLLGQALSNLIDNAVRLSEPGSVVEIGVEARRDGVAIVVSDTVAPLAGTPGAAGFGLGLVAKIADVLGAQVLAEQNRNGLVFADKPA
ncbi:MAG: hypothetical protein KIS86_01165 [Devosia sp.]|nr:hypothetical protein [Devosia sp.]